MKDYVVTVSRLLKRYGEIAAVNGITVNVKKGEIFGLLGPNGAGKTTALECLEGIRKPDGGQIRIMGIDPHKEPAKLRHVVGVQLQTSALPPSMRVGEAMKFFSAYHGIAPRYELLERMGLCEQINSQYHALSTGQKRKLVLAIAVAHQPDVLFLDEPTAGLDVATRAELHRLMADLKKEGTTIILSSHDMAEVEEMADRVAILLRGNIVAEGTPREITAAGAGQTKITVLATGTDLSAVSFPGVSRQSRQEKYQTYYTADTGPVVSAIINYIQNNKGTLLDLRVERPSLEERFLELTAQEVI